MATDWQNLEIPVKNGFLAISHLPASEKAPVQAPIIVFHGNGMNGWCHRRLVEDFEGLYPIYLVDSRGHGFSSQIENNKIVDWGLFYEDTEKVLRFIAQRHDGKDPHVIAHSLGALISIEMLNRGYKFSSLMLMEPVLLRTWEVWGVRFCQAFDRTFKGRFKSVRLLNPKVSQALKRRNVWESREAVTESYSKKSFFKAFDPQVLSDYLSRGLRETKSGVELSCSPELEAEIFHHLDTHVLTRSKEICANTTIVLGEKEGTTVSKRGRQILAKRFPDAKTESMPDQGHFMPFNVPDRVKAFIRF